MEIMKARTLAVDLISDHLTHWHFAFNNHKSSLGICKYAQRRIELSRHFVLGANADEITDTVLHEIAHAMVGHANGHNAIWRAKHISLGGNGNRTGRMTVSDHLYVGRCKCGHEFKAHRLGSTKRDGTHTGCGSSIVWTNTRTGEQTFKGQPVYSLVNVW